MNNNKTPECIRLQRVLPDLLLDPSAVPAEVRAHLGNCPACSQELSGMESVMQALDSWQAPEPSPYWMSRMEARLREEQRMPARGFAGWFGALRTRLWVSDHTMKPAGVAALGLLLAVCGGTWMDLAMQPTPVPVQASNTVRDLQSLNENAQVFQALASLDGTDDSGSSSATSN